MTDFADRVKGRMGDGEAPVDAIFAVLEEWIVETRFRGCGFVNTHAEAGALTDEQRGIIRNHKAAFASYLRTLIPEGDAVAVIVDGAIVQAAIFASAAPIDHAHRAARALSHPRSPCEPLLRHRPGARHSTSDRSGPDDPPRPVVAGRVHRVGRLGNVHQQLQEAIVGEPALDVAEPDVDVVRGARAHDE